ncbi:MAG: isochorismatase family protein [Myxococcaceae bacterium]|nr:isochorismatase family protein [Myxococcaceae bacterium]
MARLTALPPLTTASGLTPAKNATVAARPPGHPEKILSLPAAPLDALSSPVVPAPAAPSALPPSRFPQAAAGTSVVDWTARPAAAQAVREDSGARPRRFAVVMIDTQFPSIHTPEIDAMAQVLQKANAKGVPVFEVTYKGGQTDQRLSTLRAPNWQERIDKKDFSAFDGTGLEDKVRSLGITDLVLIGYKQDVCVTATADSAAGLGLSVHASLSTMQTNVQVMDKGGLRPRTAAELADSDRYTAADFEQKGYHLQPLEALVELL